MTNVAFSTASGTDVTSTPIRLGEVAGALGHPLGDHQVLDLPPGPQQPGQQRLADAAAADDRDSGHAAQASHDRRDSSATARRHHRQLAGLHHDAALAVDDGVVLVEPVLTDLHRRCTTTRSQPSAGSPRRYAVSCTVGAQPVRFTANVTGADTSPHISANSTSGATPRGRTQYLDDRRPAVGARRHASRSTAGCRSRRARCTMLGHRMTRADRQSTSSAAPASSGPPTGLADSSGGSAAGARARRG